MDLDIFCIDSYGDVYIDRVVLSDRGQTKSFTTETELETQEKIELEYENGGTTLPAGCTLRLEVISPEPVISVEVTDEEVKKNNVTYNFWDFESEKQFETWAEDNKIRLKE